LSVSTRFQVSRLLKWFYNDVSINVSSVVLGVDFRCNCNGLWSICWYKWRESCDIWDTWSNPCSSELASSLYPNGQVSWPKVAFHHQLVPWMVYIDMSHDRQPSPC